MYNIALLFIIQHSLIIRNMNDVQLHVMKYTELANIRYLSGF